MSFVVSYKFRYKGEGSGMEEKEMYELCFVGYEFPLYCVDVPFLLFCNHGTLTSCISVFHDGNKFAQGWCLNSNKKCKTRPVGFTD